MKTQQIIDAMHNTLSKLEKQMDSIADNSNIELASVTLRTLTVVETKAPVLAGVANKELTQRVTGTAKLKLGIYAETIIK